MISIPDQTVDASDGDVFSSVAWRAIDGAAEIRHWGDEYVVYNVRSGNTHLLGFAAGQIFLKLQQSAADAGSLASMLAIDWQLDPDAEFMQQIASLLADLDALALIERA
ncbi:HPr-rel-A system PqqD family peptide chaperone [Undibacterium sp.]|uniref:HPr-rel-A system PqqD family peptide chaperone n=1 Tax=Undibacterium sp. TaxID=1914977 RepID=UPI002BA0D645|nr:HPr-rel-A system PqqD family peptide chaperone [Undibacterium sp.]HTD04493.1 HPr-rel-A system PqqD family peptide chaperone [Undibacterium sp.]